MGVSTQNRGLWLVAVAFFMQTLDGTIVNTALPAMGKALNVPVLDMHLVVESYLLTLAILMPASGWLADRFGARRVFIISVGIFGLGSLLCALSTEFMMLVWARVLQGIGGALMMPVGRLAIFRTVPRKDFMAAMSFVVLPGLLGPIVGPALGGFLVQVVSWHWVFLINLPVAMLGVYFAIKVMPAIESPETPPFDWLGFLMMAVAMACLTLSFDGMSGADMDLAYALAMLVTGLVLIGCYVIYARRRTAPLFRTDLFSVASFKIGIVANLLNRMGTGAMPLLIPLYLQLGAGFSPFKAGLSMIPMALAAMAVKRPAVKLFKRYGYRRMLNTTSSLLGLCICSFALSDPAHHLWLMVLQLMILGGLNSVTFSGLGTLAMTELSNEQAGGGNSLQSVTMQLGMTIGIAAGSALLAGFEQIRPGDSSITWAFSLTFICVGIMVMLPVIMFRQLPPHVRRQMNASQDASAR